MNSRTQSDQLQRPDEKMTPYLPDDLRISSGPPPAGVPGPSGDGRPTWGSGSASANQPDQGCVHAEAAQEPCRGAGRPGRPIRRPDASDASRGPSGSLPATPAKGGLPAGPYRGEGGVGGP